jgi:hypothetical protein
MLIPFVTSFFFHLIPILLTVDISPLCIIFPILAYVSRILELHLMSSPCSVVISALALYSEGQDTPSYSDMSYPDLYFVVRSYSFLFIRI